MELSELNKNISEKKFSNLYFFLGEENYLKDFYINKIISSAVDAGMEAFNLSVYKNQITPDELTDCIEQPPVMGEYKVVCLNELNIFKGDSKLRDKLLEVIDDIPEFCILIIRETQADSKTKLYKQLEKVSCKINCAYPDDATMRAFVAREFKARGKNASPAIINKIVTECEQKMHTVLNVIEAICSYLGGTPDVTEEVTENFIVRSIETVVFNLSEFIVTKQFEKAYELLNKLKLKPSQNPAPQLFSLISRHILGIYITHLSKEAGFNLSETVAVIGNNTRDFVVKKYQNQLRNIDASKLGEIIEFCAESDYKLKNGHFRDMYLPIYQLISMFM